MGEIIPPISRFLFFLLTENGRELRKVLPIVKVVFAVSKVGLHYVYNHNCDSKYDANYKSPLAKNSVLTHGLVLAVVGFRATCDGAGKTLVTGLKHRYSGNDKDRAKEENSEKNILTNHFIIILPNV